MECRLYFDIVKQNIYICIWREQMDFSCMILAQLTQGDRLKERKEKTNT